MTYTIKNISVKRSDAQGNPFVSTYTKKEQAKVSIQVDSPEFAGKWISGFVEIPSPIEQWKIGQQVDIDITPKGNFLNFKPSKGVMPQQGNGQVMEKLFAKLTRMETMIEKIGKMVSNLESPNQSEDEIAASIPPLESESEEKIPF